MTTELTQEQEMAAQVIDRGEVVEQTDSPLVRTYYAEFTEACDLLRQLTAVMGAQLNLPDRHEELLHESREFLRNYSVV